MFCSSCGREFHEGERFCPGCGVRRGGGGVEKGEDASGPDGADWRDSFHYSRIIEQREVIDAFRKAQRRGDARVTPEEYMDLLAPVFGALGVGKATVTVGGKLGFQVYEKVGLVARVPLTCDFASPAGVTIGAVACALAETGVDVVEATESEDACEVFARTPGSLTNGPKELAVSITGSAGGARVGLVLGSPLGGFFKGRDRRMLADLRDRIEKYRLTIGT